MDSSSEEVGPTEGTVLALLDFLVDPLVPSKCVSMEAPQEDLVAKQMHAVVLLYNYYHRKQNPALEYLDSASFSKLALTLKPSLLSYLKLTQRTDFAELEDLEQHMSLTEKEITNACDICKSLDASNSEPIIDGWPITKVAVFLVDFKKENCFLFHSSVTQGVWSVIEKDLPGEEAASEARHKKKRVIKKTPKENQNPDEAVLQRVACSAVKEACALNQGDLRILETHKVYSTSKANAAVRLYIMQCTQSKEDVNLVPIDDALNSLQRPLVTQESGSWILTSAVEYFHLLPYADKVENWLSSDSKMHENAAEDFEALKEKACHGGFCFNVEKVLLPSDHSEAVEKIDKDSSSHLNQKLLLNGSEPLGTSKDDKSGNSYQSKVKVLKHNPEVPDALKEAQSGSSCQAKEEIMSFASALAGTQKEVLCGSTGHLNKEALQLASDHSEKTEILKHISDLPDALKEHQNGSSCQAKEEILSFVSAVAGTAKEVLCGSTGQLNKEAFQLSDHSEKMKVLKHTSELPDALKELENGSSCQAKEEILSPASALVGTTNEVPCGSAGHLNNEALQIASDQSEKEVENICPYRRKNKATEPVVYKKRNKSQKVDSGKCLGGQISNATAEHTRHEEDCAASGSSSSIDVYKPLRTCQPGAETHRFLSCGDHGDDQKQMLVAQEPHQSTVNGDAIVLAEVGDTNSQDQYVEKQNHATVSSTSNLEHLQKIQQSIISKEALLSQTALNVLHRKKELLSQQLRSIADEIALNDRKIEIILKGGDDDFTVQLDSIVEGCNDLCQKSGGAEDIALLNFHNPDMPPVMKRKRPSEASLCILNACEELDSVCNGNSWILPTYTISLADGGFQSNVTLKGSDFEYSGDGTVCANPQEARNSAASNMLRRLLSSK